MRGLGEHVFSITFLLFIAGRGIVEKTGTCVAGEALYMKEAMAKFAYLLVLGATINLSIAHGTFEINRYNVCPILLGEGGEGVKG